MKISMKRPLITVLLLLGGILTLPVFAVELRLHNAVLRLGSVTPGKPTPLNSLSRKRLVLQNLGTERSKIQVHVKIPLSPSPMTKTSEALPLPSSDWVTVDQTQFFLPGQGEKQIQFNLTVPDDKVFEGECYWFTLELVSRNPKLINLALRAKVYFTVKESDQP